MVRLRHDLHCIGGEERLGETLVVAGCGGGGGEGMIKGETHIVTVSGHARARTKERDGQGSLLT